VIIRYLFAAFAMVVAAPAGADELSCERHAVFQREFSEDVEGGHYMLGEDPGISARFRKAEAVAAQLKIIKPHRTKEFGSGVAFWFCDKTLNRVVRVAFGDKEGSDRLHFRVERLGQEDKKARNIVPSTALSLSKTEINRVTFRKDSKGRIVIGVDGEVFTVDPGFEVQVVHAQIYCAKGWVRFLDGELIS
jgi:hypothetical protein